MRVGFELPYPLFTHTTKTKKMTEILIILNLFILETLLSIDNAAVLALMVRDLPKDEQPKALRYGIIGAFVFRGICLLAASYLVKILWLKIAGGIFLLYLFFKHFFFTEEEGAPPTNYRFGSLSVFWSTVIMVEIMDISFSLDNVFAAVAITDNIYLIMLGVFLGIVSMRYIAQAFTHLMEKYPSLTDSAFIVIFLLGLKLMISGVTDYGAGSAYFKEVFNSHSFDLWFSGVMMLIFLIPILRHSLFRKA